MGIARSTVILMAAAQVTDMQRVWRLVQELSSQLKTNQLETERLRRYVELNPPVTLYHDSSTANGATKSGEANQLDELVQLRHAYSLLLNERDSLKIENDECTQLCAEYELGLENAVDQVRSHEYDITESTLVLHKNYASQLDAERETNQILKAEAIEMQEQLNKLSTLIRSALGNFIDVESESIIEALRIENEALRVRLQDSNDYDNIPEDQDQT